MVGRIAFTNYDTTTDRQAVFMVAADGSSSQLTTEEVVLPVVGSWSPDGRSLAITRTLCPPSPCATIISILDVGAKTFRDVTSISAGVSDGWPTFSPDGRLLAFTRAGDAGSMNLYVVDLVGSPPTRISTDASVYGPLSWSPDSTLIRYTEQPRAAPPEFFEVQPDGSGRHALSAISDLGSGNVSWSPDGGSVAFSRDSELQSTSPNEFFTVPEIWAASPLGGQPRALVPWPWHGSGQIWAPDGGSVAFVGGPAERDGLYLVGLDGSAPRLVATQGLPIDGNAIAWTATTGD